MTDAEEELEDMLSALQALRRATDEDLRAEWDRSLPFADAVFDRWKRADALGFGEGASIYDSAAVYGDVVVGQRTWVGPNALLDGSGESLRIGSWCSVSAGVQLYTHDTVLWAVSLGKQERRVGPVSIGDGCHLGAGSVVLPGVIVGERSVVAANSVVRRDVTARSIVGGVPARVLGTVEGEGESTRLVTGSSEDAAEGEGH